MRKEGTRFSVLEWGLVLTRRRQKWQGETRDLATGCEITSSRECCLGMDRGGAVGEAQFQEGCFLERQEYPLARARLLLFMVWRLLQSVPGCWKLVQGELGTDLGLSTNPAGALSCVAEMRRPPLRRTLEPRHFFKCLLSSQQVTYFVLQS